jgi:hypothetical protein
MEQKEIIEFAMIGLVYEMRQVISEDHRRELEEKHKKLAYLYYLATKEKEY